MGGDGERWEPRWVPGPDPTQETPLPLTGPPLASPVGPPPTSSGGGIGPGRAAGIGAAVALVLVGLVAGAFILGRSGSSNDDASVAPTVAETSTAGLVTTAVPATTPAVPSTTTSVAATVAAPTTTAAPVVPGARPGDVRAEPAGLFCKDLQLRGYSYVAAVDYWRENGQPDRMDADLNGIPCETVYPQSTITSYWSETTLDDIEAYSLPGGLICRDLQERGVPVYDALLYFLWEGQPARMDADGNGVPCETVYPDAAEVWRSSFT